MANDQTPADFAGRRPWSARRHPRYRPGHHRGAARAGARRWSASTAATRPRPRPWPRPATASATGCACTGWTSATLPRPPPFPGAGGRVGHPGHPGQQRRHPPGRGARHDARGGLAPGHRRQPHQWLCAEPLCPADDAQAEVRPDPVVTSPMGHLGLPGRATTPPPRPARST